MGNLWTRLPRSAQSGALIGLFVPLLLAPFLMYAGWAFKNLTEQSVQPATGNNIATLISIVALVPYLLVVFGIPAIFGGTAGLLVASFSGFIRARLRSRS